MKGKRNGETFQTRPATVRWVVAARSKRSIWMRMPSPGRNSYQKKYRRIVSEIVPRVVAVSHCFSTTYKAGEGTRTLDSHVGNVVLYQLSYTRIVSRL